MYLKYLNLIVVLAFVTLSCCESAVASPTNTVSNLNNINWGQLKSRWIDVAKEFGAPGIGIAVVQDGKTVFIDAIGYCDAAHTRPANPDTIFYIASSTKWFTACGVMSLVEKGKIDLDIPIKQYLPRFELSDASASNTLTMRDLLTHAQGISGDNFIVAGEAYTGEIDDEKFYRTLKRAFTTGKFRYGNTHYTLAGRVIEATSGKSWKDYLHNVIFKPAGMSRTTCSASVMWADDNVALPLNTYVDPPRDYTYRKIDKTMHAAGGIGSTAKDMATWLNIIMNDGRQDGKTILSQDSMREVLHPQIEVGLNFYEFQRESYGLGCYVGKYHDETLIHCFGSFTGYRPHVSFMPEHGIGVAVLMNTNGPLFYMPDQIACDIYNQVLGADDDKMPGLVDMARRRKNQGAEAIAKQELDRDLNPAMVSNGLSLPAKAYVGHYLHPDMGEMNIELHDGKLTARYGATYPLLVSTGQDELRIDILPGGRLDSPAKFTINDGVVDAIIIRMLGFDLQFNRRNPTPAPASRPSRS